MSNLIDDYLFYSSGNECPSIYHQWSIFSLIAVSLGRNVFYTHGAGGDGAYEQMVFAPELYICLVGLQGSRKSFARAEVTKIALNNLDVPISASVDTARGITMYMASPECVRTFQNHEGLATQIRPLYLSIDELVNFLSVDMEKLCSLLIGIFGVSKYVYNTAKSGRDEINNPCLNVLACATTEYIVGKLRDKMLSGGLARRMIFVNESASIKLNSNPHIPVGGAAKLERVVAHLKHIATSFKGEFKWQTHEEYARFQYWYENRKPLEGEDLMQGFSNSKHVMIYKLAMIFAAAEYEPKLFITWENFERGLALINGIEPGMRSLFAGAGRNELAGPMLKMVEVVKQSEFPFRDKLFQGVIPKKKLLLITQKDLNGMEQQNLLNHLKATDQVMVVTVRMENLDREFVMTREAKQLLVDLGIISL